MTTRSEADLAAQLILRNSVAEATAPITDITPDEASEGGFFKALGPALRQESELISPLVKSGFFEDVSDIPQLDFDPEEQILELSETSPGRLSDDFIEEALKTVNQEQFDALNAFRGKQIADRQIIADSGVGGFTATLIAANVSPIAVAGGYLGIAARTTRAANAARAAALTAGVATGQEAILQATQTERTLEESALNIGASAALGAILGGAFGRVAPDSKKTMTSVIGRTMRGEDFNTPSHGLDDSLSAARTKEDFELLKKEESPARLPTGVIKTAAPIPFLRSPVQKGLTSRFATIRGLTNRLFPHNLILGKELSDDITRGLPVRSLIDQEYIVRVSNLRRELLQLRKETNLKLSQFAEEVHNKLIKAEFDSTPIGRAAQRLHNEFEDIGEGLVKAGVFKIDDLDVKTAKAYFPRRWNQEALLTKKDLFFDRAVPRIRLYDAKGYLRKKPLSEDEALDEAQRIYDNLLKGPGVASNADSIARNLSEGKAPFSKERVFMVPDEEFAEFLDKNIFNITDQYLHQAVAIKHFKNFLDEQGLKSSSEFRDILDREFGQLIKEAGGDARKIAKLKKDLTKERKLMDEMIRLTLGISDRGDSAIERTLGVLRKFQVLTKLGGVTITSLVESAMPVFRFGLHRTVRDGLLSDLGNFANLKLKAADYRQFVNGYETQMSHVLRVMTDPGEVGYRYNPDSVMAWADRTTDVFGNVSAINYWTDIGRMNADFIAQRRIIDFIESNQAGTLSDAKRATLRSIGISRELEPKILEQVRRVSPDYKKTGYMALSKWDPELRTVFANSTFQELENVILLPRKGDIPRITQESGLGATLFQFRSFSSNATTRVLLSGMQRMALGEAQALYGMMSLVAMGAMVYIAKARLLGIEPSTDIDTLITEGMMRSGVIGLFWENALALAPLPKSSKYAGRNALNIFLGPSFGTMEDSINALYGFTDGELSESDRRRLLRLTPFNNIFYLRNLFEKAFGVER